MRRLARKLGVNLLYMAGLVVLTAPVTVLVSPAVAIAIGCMIWIFASGFALVRFEKEIDGLSIICAIVPVVMVAGGLNDYLALERANTVAGIPVAQAPKHSAHIRFEFTDASVLQKNAVALRSETRDYETGRVSYHYYNVAPLVGKGWTPAEPVPAWVGCSDKGQKTCREWRKTCTSAIVVDGLDRAGLREAVSMALSRHSLKTPPEAPLLKCVASIEAARQQRLGMLWLPFVGLYLFWAACTLIRFGVQAVRDR